MDEMIDAYPIDNKMGFCAGLMNLTDIAFLQSSIEAMASRFNL